MRPSGSLGRSPALEIFRNSLTQRQMIEGFAVRLSIEKMLPLYQTEVSRGNAPG